MQDQDLTSKEYFSVEARVADFINGFFFHGLQLIKPEDIQEADSSVFGRIKWFSRWVNRQRYRDIIRKVMMGIRFAFIGIEEQSRIHFAMPVRAMGYDFLSYDKQVKKIQKKHALLKDLKDKAQFLSGFSPDDLLEPTVTIIMYYGEEPWHGPRCLKDMLRLDDFPEDFRQFVNDYPLHIFEVNRFDRLDLFQTDLRVVFGFLQKQNDPDGLHQFVEKHEEELSSL